MSDRDDRAVGRMMLTSPWYRLPVIGGMLYRRDMRRAGRALGAAFRRGIDSVTPGIVSAVHEAMTQPAPGYEEIANEGGIRWHQRTGTDD